MIADPIDACRFWLHDTVAPQRFTDAEIQEFLDLEKVIDVDGFLPSDTINWTPTYDVLRAAGRGWLWLGACVGNTSQYKAGDVSVTYERDYCMRRARELLGASSSTVLRRDEQTEPDVLDRFRS
jgi:hypothetical protein